MSTTMESMVAAFMDADGGRRTDALRVLRGEARAVDSGPAAAAGDGRPAGPLLLGMGAAAAWLGVSRATLWRLTSKGWLPKVELLPGSYRVRRTDLEALAKAGRSGMRSGERGPKRASRQ